MASRSIPFGANSTARQSHAGAVIRSGKHRLLSWRKPLVLPSWAVLDPFVDLGLGAPPPTVPGDMWAIVACASKKAYGCGEHGQKVLDGLVLHVRLITYPVSDLSTALYIQANDDSLCGIQALFQAEFPEDYSASKGDSSPIEIGYEELFVRAHVQTAGENLIVLTVVFRLRQFRRLAYYLVYDANDQSLAMIPCPPDRCPVESTLQPLTVPRDGGGYELVVMAEKMLPLPLELDDRMYDEVLWVWTPEVKCGLWQLQQMQQLHTVKAVMEPFAAEVMFSFDGRAFFVDLSQGLLYCNLPTADCSPVEFDFIPLPAEIPTELRWEKTKPEDMGPLNFSRTMRCVRGSIMFVCIERSSEHPGKGKLTVWTLDLSNKQWTKLEEFLVRDIWKLYTAKLPMTEPKFPILMPDGTLCLVLPYKRNKVQDPMVDCICNLRVHRNRLTLLWWSSLRNYRSIEPAILPIDFFKRLHSPGILRRGIVM